MGADARKSPRSRVHLRVTFRGARDFVEQYAENLSAGGLFVRDVKGLRVRERVTLALELPGHGAYAVEAEVAHVAGPEHARPGVGLQLVVTPPGFQQALETYLLQLGRRADAKVFVDAEPWRSLLAEAGYQVLPLPPPTQLVRLIGDTAAVGVLPPVAAAEPYRGALAFLGLEGSLVIPIDDRVPVEPVLAWLDSNLLAAR